MRNATILPVALLAAVVLLVLVAPALSAVKTRYPAELPAVYLTIESDPYTTMTVNWLDDQPDRPAAISYRMVGENGWTIVVGRSQPLFAAEEIQIRRVFLEGLEPDRAYEFKLAQSDVIERFRTVSDSPDVGVRFIEGGDIYTGYEEMRHLNRVAGRQNPDFVIIGGDIATACGEAERVGKWLEFMSCWHQTLRTEDDRLVPIIAAIGNHEVDNGGFDRPQEDAPFFYSIFHMPCGEPYRTVDFGKHMSIFVLDSGHTRPVWGEQADWLEQALKERQDVTHRFALYHVPAYPSHRKYSGSDSRRVRNYWTPLFDKYDLQLAFEHHDHCYKRTQPLKHGRVDPTGTVYLGDGGWGLRENRIPDDPGDGGLFANSRWYLAHTASRNFFRLITIRGERQTIEAIGEDGKVFDRVEFVAGQPKPVVDTPHTPIAARLETWLVAGGLMGLALWSRKRAAA